MKAHALYAAVWVRGQLASAALRPIQAMLRWLGPVKATPEP